MFFDQQYEMEDDEDDEPFNDQNVVNGRNNEILAASEYIGNSPNRRAGPGKIHVTNP